MEIWDLYNLKREVIGEHIRGTELPENGFHLVVHVWITNSEGKYLMTQRNSAGTDDGRVLCRRICACKSEAFGYVFTVAYQ